MKKKPSIEKRIWIAGLSVVAGLCGTFVTALALELMGLDSEAAFTASAFWVFAASVVFICGAIYMIPTIIAFRRNAKDSQYVLLLNVATGWTLVGWVACFIWAVQMEQVPQRARSATLPPVL